MNDEDPAVEAMIAHLAGIAQRVGGCGADIEAVRAAIEDYSRLDDATREVDARWTRVSQPAGEWVLAPGADPQRRLLYLHGGSWLSGSPPGYRPLAARISRETGCAVFVLDYPLAPEQPYPAALDACAAAWQWLAGYGPRGAALADQMLVAGDSAGGNLALALVLKLARLETRQPDAVIALSPAVDLGWHSPSLTTHAEVDPVLRPERLSKVVEAYLQGAESVTHPFVSPLFGDFAHLPRALVQVGDREVLLDDAKGIAARMQEQGVAVELEVYPGMPHVFQLFAPTVGAASQALERIGAFARADAFAR